MTNPYAPPPEPGPGSVGAPKQQSEAPSELGEQSADQPVDRVRQANQPAYGERRPSGGTDLTDPDPSRQAAREAARRQLTPGTAKRPRPGAPPASGDRPNTRAARRQAAADRLAQRLAEMPKLTSEQRKEFQAVGRMVMRFGLALVAGFFLMIAPLPWPAAGMALILAGAVMAIRGIRRARRLPSGHGAVASLTAGLVLAGLMLLYGAGMAIQWPAQWHFQQCTGQAITEQAHEDCKTAYDKESQSILQRLSDRGK